VTIRAESPEKAKLWAARYLHVHGKEGRVVKDGVVKTVDDFGRLVHDKNYGMVYYVFLLDLDESIYKECDLMEKRFLGEDCWPERVRDEQSWLHNDMKDLSYLGVHTLFDEITTQGGMR